MTAEPRPSGVAPPVPGTLRYSAALDMVIWADARGALHAVDQLCPHMQASLRDEGIVVGDDLVCMAHGWRISPDGCVFKLAMSGRRDEKDRLPMPRCTTAPHTPPGRAEPTPTGSAEPTPTEVFVHLPANS